MEIVIIGVHGHVVSLDKENGKEKWRTSLSSGFGESFVSLATDGQQVFAHTRGKLYCLDFDSGKILWMNDLPGLGYGIASICATEQCADLQSALKANKKRTAGS